MTPAQPQELAVRHGVYEAIRAVQRDMARDGISKGRKNQQQGYSFRGIDDVYNALANSLADHGLCIIPRFMSRHCDERPSKSGGALFNVVVDAEFDLVGMDGSVHTAKTYGEAMDSADKATNKAMSAAYKYMCLQVFCIPTEGDNDADATTHEPRGSVQAAQQVGKQRIVELEQRRPAKGLNTPAGPYEPPVPTTPPATQEAILEAAAQLEAPATVQGMEQRHADKQAELDNAPDWVKPKPKAEKKTKEYKNFTLLDKFKAMKELLRAESGDDTLYYAILKQNGYEKSNQVPSAEGDHVGKQMKAAHATLKHMRGLREEIADLRKALGDEQLWADICRMECGIIAAQWQAAEREPLEKLAEVLRKRVKR